MNNGNQEVASGLRLVLMNASYQGMANVYYLVVRGVYVVLFARLLGVEQYGYYVYSQGWYLLALAIAGWGMAELAMAERARLRPEYRQVLLSEGFALRLLLCTCGSALVVVAA